MSCTYKRNLNAWRHLTINVHVRIIMLPVIISLDTMKSPGFLIPLQYFTLKYNSYSYYI